MAKGYFLGAYWPARRESVDECADRLAAFLDDLRACGEPFAKWYPHANSRAESLRKGAEGWNGDRLRDLLNNGRNRYDTTKEVIEDLGFRVGFWNGEGKERSISISVTCGLYAPANLSNCVYFRLPDDVAGIGGKVVIARVLRSVVTRWNPAWAGVMSEDAKDQRNFPAKEPFVDWMVYVPTLVEGVEPPSCVMTLPGFGSIVIVQPDPPRTDDPEALRRVQRVEQLIARSLA